MFLKEGYLYKKSDGMMGLFEVYLFLNLFFLIFLEKRKNILCWVSLDCIALMMKEIINVKE